MPVLGLTQLFARKSEHLMIVFPDIQTDFVPSHEPFNHETKENCFTSSSSAGLKRPNPYLLKSES